MEEYKFAGLKITKCTVVRDNGTDSVVFTVDGPTAFPETKYPLDIKMDTRRGYAEEWLRQNMPELSFEVIDVTYNKTVGRHS